MRTTMAIWYDMDQVRTVMLRLEQTLDVAGQYVCPAAGVFPSPEHMGKSAGSMAAPETSCGRDAGAAPEPATKASTPSIATATGDARAAGENHR